MPPRLPPADPFIGALGRAVSDLRREREMTQEMLAANADLHTTWISRIESGRVNPTAVNLARLSRGLGVKLSEIIIRAEELER